MRFVYLTDDAGSIDRRTLHQADSLAELGHEVIIVARQDGKAPDSARIGGAKIQWVDVAFPRFVGPNVKSFVVALGQALYRRAFFWRRALDDVRRAPKPGWATKLIRLVRHRQREWPRLLGRAFDPWLPIHRRARLLSIIMALTPIMLLASVFGMFAFIVRSTIDRLTYSPAGRGKGVMEPTAWDKAMAHYGSYYDPDVIIATDLPQLMGAVMAKRQTKAKLIYDAHEFYSDISTLTEQERHYLRTRERKLLPEVDEAITVNPLIADLFKSIYRKRFSVVQNATIPPPGFSHQLADKRIHKHLRLSPDRKILLYQGWLPQHVRGIEELIAGMAKVRSSVDLVLMGYGDFDWFHSIAIGAGSEKRVHFIEAVPQEELVWWSAAADVGVIPYKAIDKLHEMCSPNKLYEFIAARLPILASDLPFLRMVVEAEGFGINRKMTTPDEFAAAIDEMFDPAAEYISRSRANMIAKGRDWEWAVESRKFLEIVDRLGKPVRKGDYHTESQLLAVPWRPPVLQLPAASNRSSQRNRAAA